MDKDKLKEVLDLYSDEERTYYLIDIVNYLLYKCTDFSLEDFKKFISESDKK